MSRPRFPSNHPRISIRASPSIDSTNRIRHGRLSPGHQELGRMHAFSGPYVYGLLCQVPVARFNSQHAYLPTFNKAKELDIARGRRRRSVLFPCTLSLTHRGEEVSGMCPVKNVRDPPAVQDPCSQSLTTDSGDGMQPENIWLLRPTVRSGKPEVEECPGWHGFPSV